MLKHECLLLENVKIEQIYHNNKYHLNLHFFVLLMRPTNRYSRRHARVSVDHTPGVENYHKESCGKSIIRRQY